MLTIFVHALKDRHQMKIFLKILVKIRSGVVRNYIIKNKMIDYKCDVCGLNGIWLGNPLTLHLDHKDGVRGNNEIENLRFLCPNCHEQTDTNKGKNTKKLKKG